MINLFSFSHLVLSSIARALTEALPEVASSNSQSFQINWFDVCFQLIITVIGFIFAIWSSKWLDKQKDKQDAIKLKGLLSDELNAIKSVLSTYRVGLLEPQPIKSPMWESVINTGQLNLFDFETREVLFRVYSQIKEFNSWSLIYTNYYFEKDVKNQKIIVELNNIKNKLLENNGPNTEDQTISISQALAKLNERN